MVWFGLQNTLKNIQIRELLDILAYLIKKGLVRFICAWTLLPKVNTHQPGVYISLFPPDLDKHITKYQIYKQFLTSSRQTVKILITQKIKHSVFCYLHPLSHYMRMLGHSIPVSMPPRARIDSAPKRCRQNLPAPLRYRINAGTLWHVYRDALSVPDVKMVTSPSD